MMSPLRSSFALLVLTASGIAAASPIAGQGTWEATLLARDLDRDGQADAYYDTVLNVTWLRDANASGVADWGSARNWASQLVIGGQSGWRLPITAQPDPSCSGQSNNVGSFFFGCQGGEMGHLYYVAFGNKGYWDQAGTFQADFGMKNTGGFINFQSGTYWTGTEFAFDVDGAWIFKTFHGGQDFDAKSANYFAIAVHDGDVVGALPEPNTLVILLGGLGAIAAVRRKTVSQRRQWSIRTSSCSWISKERS